jgi:hypothetical protein
MKCNKGCSQSSKKHTTGVIDNLTEFSVEGALLRFLHALGPAGNVQMASYLWASWIVPSRLYTLGDPPPHEFTWKLVGWNVPGRDAVSAVLFIATTLSGSGSHQFDRLFWAMQLRTSARFKSRCQLLGHRLPCNMMSSRAEASFCLVKARNALRNTSLKTNINLVLSTFGAWYHT